MNTASFKKIAIVHDWLDTWGGGEAVLGQLLALYPGADLFALVDFFCADDRARLGLGARRVKTSFIQKLPFSREHFRRYLPLFPRAIEGLDLAEYDLVLSSSHAIAKGVKTDGHQLHLCYCYTPMRYAWDLQDQYLTQVGLDRGVAGHAARRLLGRLRTWDRAASARVDRFIAISRYIADRIARCYGRDAEVIYPPVPTSPQAALPRKDYYVTVSRLVPYKKIDLIAAAFRALPDRRLIVVGDGPERSRIEAAAGDNVRLVGNVDVGERDRWLAQARAFVFVADEDFGMAPIEAQAQGTPVIAYGRGGVTETIRDLKEHEPTGVFFDAQTPASIVQGILAFEANEERVSERACRDNAMRFSPRRFQRELTQFVERCWSEFASTREAAR